MQLLFVALLSLLVYKGKAQDEIGAISEVGEYVRIANNPLQLFPHVSKRLVFLNIFRCDRNPVQSFKLTLISGQFLADRTIAPVISVIFTCG